MPWVHVLLSPCHLCVAEHSLTGGTGMNFSECLHQRQSDDSIAEPLNCLDFPKASQASGSFTCSFNFINKDNRPHKGLPKAAKPMVFLPSDSWSLTKKKNRHN